MFRSVILVLSVMAWVGAWAGASQAQGPVAGRTYRVGFTQIVDHPALNAVRQGFLEGLKEAGFVEGRNLRFDYVDAQGDVGATRGIAEKFVAEKVDLLAPCSTPSTLAAIKAASGTTVPVAFGCVTYPVESGVLAATNKATGTNVTGFYGLPPSERMWELLLLLHPQARIVGTLYNPAESHSLALNASSKAIAVARGLSWAEVQVSSPADVLPSVRALMGRVDCLLLPQDSTLAAAFDAIVVAAREAKIPLFSFDPGSVERGAVAAFAPNQRQAGLDWAREFAVPVLLGKAPGTLKPAPYTAYSLLLNRAAAKAAGITLPPELLAAALKVWDE